MSKTTSTSFEKTLFDYIEGAIKEAINDAFDKAIKQAVEDAEAKRDEIVAKTALRLSDYMNIRDMGQTLRIEISKELK